MEGTRPSTVNSIGMFDMLKGMGMITIVLAHTGKAAWKRVRVGAAEQLLSVRSEILATLEA